LLAPVVQLAHDDGRDFVEQGAPESRWERRVRVLVGGRYRGLAEKRGPRADADLTSGRVQLTYGEGAGRATLDEIQLLDEAGGRQRADRRLERRSSQVAAGLLARA
jgi:hypothetical protein